MTNPDEILLQVVEMAFTVSHPDGVYHMTIYVMALPTVKTLRMKNLITVWVSNYFI